MAVPVWQADLADSATMQRLTPLRSASNKHLELILNTPGAFSFTLPIDSPEAKFIQTITTCVRLRMGQRTVWSGPVWATTEDTPEGHMSVSCVGWAQRLYRRIINPGQEETFANVDSGLIAHTLLAKANALGPTVTGSPSSTLILPGNRDAAPVRTRTYAAYQNIGQTIQELSAIENGFDYEVDPIERKLNIYHPMKGDDKVNLLFSLRPDDAATILEGKRRLHTLKAAQRQSDAARFRNKQWVLGGSGQVGFAEDVASQQSYGLFEDQASLSDVSSPTVLASYANAELFVYKRPFVTHNVVPLPAVPGSPAPSLFVDYGIGDIVYFTVHHGTFQAVRQAIRVFGASLTITNEDVPMIDSLQVSAT